MKYNELHIVISVMCHKFTYSHCKTQSQKESFMPKKLPHDVHRFFKINFLDQFLLGFVSGQMAAGKTDEEACRVFQDYIQTDEDACPLSSIKARYYILKSLYIDVKADLWPIN